ncbi:DHH family phosphoesterase [Ligilactobacillus saerimneri]|uniref:DHH family phosphoesterase n=1 Tax=Ligilactobacillus saerimneri TaxID=228229 RepID=UPI0024B9FEAC|nr:DHH family phosphoesterase [Ligilactobacillus saerimneri]
MKKFFFRDFWRLPEFMSNDRLRWIAFFLVVISLISVYLSLSKNILFGIVILAVVILMLAIIYIEFQQMTQDTSDYISDLSYRIKRGEQEALIRMPLGVLLLDQTGDIEWVNPYMQRYFGKDDVIGKKIATVDPELGDLIAENWEVKKPIEVTWKDQHFQMYIQADIDAVYMMDITHYFDIEERFRNTRLIIGQIFLDNYDEVSKTMADETISNINNYITTTLSEWAHKMGVFLKQVDEDHFFIIGYRQSLVRMENRKFRVLDKIRKDTSKQNNPLTLSIGIAYGGDDLNEMSKQAQSNMDLALGRGGDQAVIRKVNGRQPRFYGGKTNPMEKRTRVRARMISQALQELIRQSDQIFVMGHMRPDMDSIGAAMGIRRIAQMNGRKCWIVMDQEHLHSDIQRLMEEVQNEPALRTCFITPEEAHEKVTRKSLLIMVDHSKPSMTTDSQLYELMQNRVMVIDHHRRGEEFPENPILVYIEPYASSTCELITELFEYQAPTKEPITRLEATVMLTGITIDTKSFTLRTGTRTFDAASYLRSVGADATLMQHFMKEDVQSYMQRNHLIDLVEFVGPDRSRALCAGENDRIFDAVAAAQAADSLLTVSGVQASYVISRRDEDTIGISARSNGKVNVQIVMEKLGGGGHLSNAATQITGKTVAEVRKQLLELINDEQENNNDEPGTDATDA